jgi:Zn-dependent hydrolases, including glyoxylases
VEIQRLDTHLKAIDSLLFDVAGLGLVYVVEGDQIALIETGTPRSAQHTLAGLRELGIHPEAVQHIICTHIHLDHAGGAGILAQALPNATVYMHSSMIPHLIDPTRLIRGTIRAVGEELWRTYDEPLPIAPERLSPSDNLRLDLGRGIVLEAIATPGHCPDHMAFHDLQSGALFIGDAAGTATPRWNLVRPMTPPPTYDLVAQQQTIAALRKGNFSRLYFSHCGAYDNVDETLAELADGLDRLIEGVRRALAAGESDPNLIAERLLPIPPDAPDSMPLRTWASMSIAGLIRYEQKRTSNA